MTNEFKNFAEIPPAAPQPVKAIKNHERIHLYDPRPRESVVNSEAVKWKPIDIVAARVVAKAPWWAEPPVPPPKIIPKKAVMKSVTKTENLADAAETGIPSSDFITQNQAMDLGVRVASDRAKDRAKGLNEAELLVERAKDVAAAIDYLNSHGRDEWQAFQEWTRKAIAEARQSKIALEIETRQLMADLREVRAFFLDDKHQEQVERLEKFVRLCQELKALKESGFLDSVADTILKLDS